MRCDSLVVRGVLSAKERVEFAIDIVAMLSDGRYSA
jgi:hypothetical protein